MFIIDVELSKASHMFEEEFIIKLNDGSLPLCRKDPEFYPGGILLKSKRQASANWNRSTIDLSRFVRV